MSQPTQPQSTQPPLPPGAVKAQQKPKPKEHGSKTHPRELTRKAMIAAANVSDSESTMFRKTVAQLVDEGLDALFAEDPRSHMGFSEIGGEDLRHVWLNFFWCLPDDKSPRMRLLLNTGHIMEDVIAQAISMAPGLTLYVKNPKTGKQYGWKLHGGHFAGSCDGLLHGVPVAPTKWHIWEMKTSNDDSFKQLLKTKKENDGDASEWNPNYKGQKHCYMGASGVVDRHLMTVMNKNNSQLDHSRSRLNPDIWLNMQSRALKLLMSPAPPESPYQPTDYRIKNWKNEEYQAIYWGRQLPAPNCRNCKFSKPVIDESQDAKWHCSTHDKHLTVDEQRLGCRGHLFRPELVTQDLGTLVEDHGNVVRYIRSECFGGGGFEFWNAVDTSEYKSSLVFTSWELHNLTRGDNFTAETFRDDTTLKLRAAFEGDFVGEIDWRA